MIFGTISSAQRRLLVFAATFFFLGSVYYCTYRLVSASFSRQSVGSSSNGGNSPLSWSSGSDDDDDDDRGPPITSYHDVKLNHADLPMVYDLSGRPALDDLVTTQALRGEYVPTETNGHRLIVVSDIHGMDEALSALLQSVGYSGPGGKDHIVATGDVVGKGPDSAAVVDRLMSLNATAVRGNHEDRLLLTHREAESRRGVAADIDAQQGSLAAAAHRGQSDYVELARTLSPDQLDWLDSLPVILTIEPLRLAVVHAGLLPGTPLELQDPAAVMNMRTVSYPRVNLRSKAGEHPAVLPRFDSVADPEAGIATARKDSPPTATAVDSVPSDEPTLESLQEMVDGAEDEVSPTAPEDDENYIDTSEITYDRQVAIPSDSAHGEKWAEAWTAYQKRLPREDRLSVIYGHDSRTGYVETDYTIGIDSGCVKGGSLSALIVEADPFGKGFKHTVLQVECTKPSP